MNKKDISQLYRKTYEDTQITKRKVQNEFVAARNNAFEKDYATHKQIFSIFVPSHIGLLLHFYFD